MTTSGEIAKGIALEVANRVLTLPVSALCLATAGALRGFAPQMGDVAGAIHLFLVLAGATAAGALIRADTVRRLHPSRLPRARRKLQGVRAQTLRRYWTTVGTIVVAIGLLDAYANYRVWIWAERETLSEPKGLLRPAGDEDPSLIPSYMASSAKVIFGDNVKFVSAYAASVPVLTLRKRRIVTLHFDESGMSVSADIFDANGLLLARIDHNSFTVGNDAFSFDRPDASTLAVTAKLGGEEALWVRFVNERTVKVRGTFRYRGVQTVVARDDGVFWGSAHFSGSVSSGAGGMFAFGEDP